jgi:hypothetical protein
MRDFIFSSSRECILAGNETHPTFRMSWRKIDSKIPIQAGFGPGEGAEKGKSVKTEASGP